MLLPAVFEAVGDVALHRKIRGFCWCKLLMGLPITSVEHRVKPFNRNKQLILLLPYNKTSVVAKVKSRHRFGDGDLG